MALNFVVSIALAILTGAGTAVGAVGAAIAGRIRIGRMRPPHARRRPDSVKHEHEPMCVPRAMRKHSFKDYMKIGFQSYSKPLQRIFKEKHPQLNYEHCMHIAIVGPQNSGKTTISAFLRFTFQHLLRTMQDNEDDTSTMEVAESVINLEPQYLRDIVAKMHRDQQSGRPTTAQGLQGPTPHVVGTAVFWDFPGFGTSTHPGHSFVRWSGIRYVSSVVVVVGESNHEATDVVLEDLWRNHISCSVVRTHMDCTLQKELDASECRASSGGLLQLPADNTGDMVTMNMDPNECRLTLHRMSAMHRSALRDEHQLDRLNHEPFVVNAWPKAPTRQNAGKPEAEAFDMTDFMAYILQAGYLAHEPPEANAVE